MTSAKMISKDSDIPVHQCDQCDKTYKYKGKLNTHIHKVHKDADFPQDRVGDNSALVKATAEIDQFQDILTKSFYDKCGR